MGYNPKNNYDGKTLLKDWRVKIKDHFVSVAKWPAEHAAGNTRISSSDRISRNAKAPMTLASQSASRLIPSADKKKPDGIAERNKWNDLSNVYVHRFLDSGDTFVDKGTHFFEQAGDDESIVRQAMLPARIGDVYSGEEPNPVSEDFDVTITTGYIANMIQVIQLEVIYQPYQKPPSIVTHFCINLKAYDSVRIICKNNEIQYV